MVSVAPRLVSIHGMSLCIFPEAENFLESLVNVTLEPPLWQHSPVLARSHSFANLLVPCDGARSAAHLPTKAAPLFRVPTSQNTLTGFW